MSGVRKVREGETKYARREEENFVPGALEVLGFWLRRGRNDFPYWCQIGKHGENTTALRLQRVIPMPTV